MSTRAIRTSTPQVACDVCGRTLLRGERSEVYLAGGARHSVCELCTSRALHGGWIREGTVPDFRAADERLDRRRSLLGRRRRAPRPEPDESLEAPAGFFAPDDEVAVEDDGRPPLGLVPGATEIEPAAESEFERGAAPDWPARPPRGQRRPRRRRPVPFGFRQDAGAPRPEGRGAPREPGSRREPRHVHAVPTSAEHRIDAAVELFNRSEHPRTVAGISRSLGLPDVSVHPTGPTGAMVGVLVCWELCWYRYEVDLSEEQPVVRGAGQGYELSELSELERAANATADGQGVLTPI